MLDHLIIKLVARKPGAHSHMSPHQVGYEAHRNLVCVFFAYLQVNSIVHIIQYDLLSYICNLILVLRDYVYLRNIINYLACLIYFISFSAQFGISSTCLHIKRIFQMRKVLVINHFIFSHNIGFN